MSSPDSSLGSAFSEFAGPAACLDTRLESCLESYRDYVARTYRNQFGIHDAAQANLVADSWFHCDERHDFRFEEMETRIAGPGTVPDGSRARRFLDLASGMGTAALRGLQRGHDGFGIEPDAEKLGLVRQRIAAGNLPTAWVARFARAVGERLPYKSAVFDCVLSYQTLEHVQDVDAVLAEMLRVTRPGGGLHLRCPDYRGTFEGHYLLPWLPLLPRPLARVWLRLCGRPLTGFAGIRYVTKPGLIRALQAAARRTGTAIEIRDLEAERLRRRLREKGLPGWSGPAWFWKALVYARRAFREDLQINLWVSVGSIDSIGAGRARM